MTGSSIKTATMPVETLKSVFAGILIGIINTRPGPTQERLKKEAFNLFDSVVDQLSKENTERMYAKDN